MHLTRLLPPVLSPLLADRRMCLALLGAAVAHFGAAEMGLTGWQCPVRHTLNVPCPGCGLTRATKLLLQGHWQHGLQVHAFAPALLLFAVVLVVVAVLPAQPRQTFLNTLAGLERYTSIAVIALVALVGYWLVRFVFYRSALYSLVM